VRVFEGNFKGTYMHPSSSWDLQSCKQKPGESLRDYIQCFSKQRTELPNITNSDVIMTFLSGTIYKELVQELGRSTPITANGLMDIITNFAAGEEAVGAIFGSDQDKGKHKEEDPAGSSRVSKRNNRKKKKNQQGKQEAPADDLVATVDRKKPRGPPGGGIFDKMLKEPCLYHKGPMNHNLEDCHMLLRYFESIGVKKDDKKEDPKGDDKDEGFLEIYDCFMIYGGASTRLSTQQRKREHREVFSVQLVTPSSLTGLRWPSLLTVTTTQTTSPILGSTHLLSIPSSPTHASPRCSWMAAVVLTSSMPRPSTFWESQGRTFDPASGASMESCQGSEQNPSGGSTCLSVSALPPTSGRRLSLSKWLDSIEHTTPSLGAHATPGSWWSPITPTSSSKCQAPTVS
jgi:hypothetical protein